jgi:hypothetical protein
MARRNAVDICCSFAQRHSDVPGAARLAQFGAIRPELYAIAQINGSIELVRCRDYDGAFLTLDLVASTSATATAAGEVGDAP